MNVATGTTLVELLARSQLLSEEELAKAKSRWQEVVRTGQEPPAEELAALWGPAQLITRWQAEQLLTGRFEFFLGKLLSEGPLTKRAGWTNYVNGVETEAELLAIRRSIVRGTPFGAEAWQQSTATLLGLESSLRPRGRPRKSEK